MDHKKIRRHRITVSVDSPKRVGVWCVGDLLREGTRYLAEHKIEAPRLQAERLLGHVLGLPRIGLYLSFDRPVSPSEKTAFGILLRKRASGEPLQYLLGETEFMSLPFRVTPAVLIPRPETELLVERVLERFRQPRGDGRSPYRILDLGTGSGAIAVALAIHLRQVWITAADISEEALRIAQENAERNGVSDKIRFGVMDLNHPPAGVFDRTYDAVVSNPPYVSLQEWDSLPIEVRDHEPRIALCDEGDGLHFYRTIAKHAPRWLRPGGEVFVEMGGDRQEAVCGIFASHGFRVEGVFEDLNRIPRVGWFRLKDSI